MPTILGYGRAIGPAVWRRLREHLNDCQAPGTGQETRIAASYLPIPRRTGNRSLMRAQIISMLLLFAVLIGSLVMPVSSHAEGMPAGHASEVLNIEDHVDAVTGQHDKKSGDVPCHAIAHHHCSIAVKTDAEIDALGIWSATVLVMPQTVYPLKSLGSAPPIEPPAA